MEKVSNYTYRLQLPDEMKRLHNVFHTALLWAYVPPDPDLLPLREPDFSTLSKTTTKPPILPPTGMPTNVALLPDDPTQLEPGEFLVEKVCSRRLKKHGKSFQYRVKWVGYAESENTWVSRSNAATEGIRQLFDDFDKECAQDNRDDTDLPPAS